MDSFSCVYGTLADNENRMHGSPVTSCFQK